MLVNIKMFDFTQVLGTKIVGITKEGGLQAFSWVFIPLSSTIASS